MYWRETDYANISDLTGKVIKSVSINDKRDEITFETECGQRYLMYHDQDCCESVYIEDINGDLQVLVGEEILLADEYSRSETDSEWGDSATWTFYHIRSMKENVSIRWFGSSNGYYSERVDFVRYLTEEEKQKRK